MNDNMSGLGKAVLFDCDGVLVDSEPALARIAAIALGDFGAPAKAEDFKPYIGMGEEKYLGEVLKKYGVQFTPDVKAHVYEKYIELAPDYVEAFAGVRELLQQLKNEGYRIAVASSADLIKVEANLKVLNVSDNIFDAVITGSDIERKKPFPDIYLLAAERCGIDPAMCYVVEDAVSGVQAAKAAKMTAIGFTSAHSGQELSDAGADYLVDNMAKVADIVK
jgi:HAD superfamily hydrolase (TIGR01509 family)